MLILNNTKIGTRNKTTALRGPDPGPGSGKPGARIRGPDPGSGSGVRMRGPDLGLRSGTGFGSGVVRFGARIRFLDVLAECH